jgi:hypothetical protein
MVVKNGFRAYNVISKSKVPERKDMSDIRIIDCESVIEANHGDLLELTVVLPQLQAKQLKRDQKCGAISVREKNGATTFLSAPRVTHTSRPRGMTLQPGCTCVTVRGCVTRFPLSGLNHRRGSDSRVQTPFGRS